ncbi:uncharacterized protein ARMOST_10618 [Armillaria ostoyae]|uniref:Uncharacterized protein n=1 Tax=Armillaria ostoyae TaxID=47428 RepID=A0A284REX0_ARMOS|nr:uncharacterized protein ARMOST_10618 [Armillaria ostoyae]
MENNQSWDSALKIFFKEIGLIQALRGFELDMLVLNPTWERETVPGALERLHSPDPEPDTLDDRKAALYTDLPPPTTLTKSISQYLSRNRARNDASNRAEFLRPASDTSCARTDAKTLNRDTQMKYDIAKNEDGPLRRTMKRKVSEEKADEAESPALSERIVNVETHLAWPPPPPSTPIIVPPHLRSREPPVPSTAPQAAGGAKGKSSLTRAVMERLEVEKAMKDLGSSKPG